MITALCWLVVTSASWIGDFIYTYHDAYVKGAQLVDGPSIIEADGDDTVYLTLRLRSGSTYKKKHKWQTYLLISIKWHNQIGHFDLVHIIQF